MTDMMARADWVRSLRSGQVRRSFERGYRPDDRCVPGVTCSRSRRRLVL